MRDAQNLTDHASGSRITLMPFLQLTLDIGTRIVALEDAFSQQERRPLRCKIRQTIHSEPAPGATSCADSHSESLVRMRSATHSILEVLERAWARYQNIDRRDRRSNWERDAQGF